MFKSVNKKKVFSIIIIFFSIITLLATFFTIKIIDKINNFDAGEISIPSDNNEESNTTTYPSLYVEDSIVIDKYETYKFSFTVKDLSEYCVKIDILNDDIAKIDSQNVITPIKVGQTTIISSINCDPKIEKKTNLVINDAVSDYTYKILDQNNNIANYTYVNNVYFLEITENSIVSALPIIKYNKNFISNFEFVSKNKNVIVYKFKLIQAGEYNFEYISKYCEKSTDNFISFNYPSTFNVDFNVSSQNNTIRLYIFNNRYLSQANADGYFNFCSFELTTVDNSNEIINVTKSSNIVEIKNNTIFAMDEGQCNISFISEITGNKKEFSIIVQKILANEIFFNNTSYEFNNTIDLVLQLNQEANFNIKILPIYFYGELSIDCSDGVIISNNKIKLLSNEDQIVKISYNNLIILQFNISPQKEYKIEISVFECTTEYTNCNHDITITFSNECFLVLKCEVYEGNSLNLNQNLSILYNSSIITTTDNSCVVKNNFITLEILEKGSCTIEIFNRDLNISKIITINVV